MMPLKTLPMLLACLLLLAPVVTRPAAAQGVLVAPTSIVVDGRVRTGSLMLVNPNGEPVELELSTIFGYPVTDSATGQLRLHTEEHPDSASPSAASWIRIFPRRLTLAPKAQQTVRLLVTPPPGLAEGEYWARLVVTARGGHVQLADVADTALKVGLSVEVRTILPVMYRVGKLRTTVALSGLRAQVQDDSLVVRSRMERQGNAAAIGTARGELVDASGKVRSSFSMPVAVYYGAEPRFTAPLAGLPPGTYRLRLEVVGRREDLAPETVLAFPVVRDSVTVSVP
ncbi:MAG TPA: hypothetical protein VFS40_09760 [Gemmatimonadales bacterium]|nr:hypothetical protein [Gemmatimonadales bacterium]